MNNSTRKPDTSIREYARMRMANKETNNDMQSIIKMQKETGLTKRRPLSGQAIQTAKPETQITVPKRTKLPLIVQDFTLAYDTALQQRNELLKVCSSVNLQHKQEITDQDRLIDNTIVSLFENLPMNSVNTVIKPQPLLNTFQNSYLFTNSNNQIDFEVLHNLPANVIRKISVNDKQPSYSFFKQDNNSDVFSLDLVLNPELPVTDQDEDNLYETYINNIIDSCFKTQTAISNHKIQIEQQVILKYFKNMKKHSEAFRQLYDGVQIIKQMSINFKRTQSKYFGKSTTGTPRLSSQFDSVANIKQNKHRDDLESSIMLKKENMELFTGNDLSISQFERGSVHTNFSNYSSNTASLAELKRMTEDYFDSFTE
ncbi:Hypothetical_protein [Hexamita inflata]|uniref:Hypothetical_protein n=1 Tax=Hexamita inflata TaxID=28002 RepID=A0AA86UBB2_9EUKA|nr:Hypothetical protein HINF_LOCUS32207 [Hexamita inflata]